MVASPKPHPPSPGPDRGGPGTGVFPAVANRDAGGGPPPGTPDKTIHNEITKLKANTVNAAAIAFFIGGGIAPLVGAGTNGFSLLQAGLGLVWVFVGLVLHFTAQTILRDLLP